MRAAVWARVSSTDQHASNQSHVLREWAERRGLEIVTEIITEDSAWQNGNGTKGKEFDKARDALLNGARLGHYQVVLCWAVDRLSRRGIEDTLATMRRIYETGCDIWSHEESWLVTSEPRMRELLVSFMAWIAEQESARRSERIKLGMERRKREGKPVGGRVEGARDRKPRRTEGYLETWARRKAAEPVPAWVPEAQALYDDLDPGTGRPAWTVEAIGQQAGVSAKVVNRWVSHNGPGGKARERRRKAS